MLIPRGIMSHPTRGAWIEIYPVHRISAASVWSHPTRGAWIEIFVGGGWKHGRPCRTLPGVRGLKYNLPFDAGMPEGASHPTRGAWIEIFYYEC